ncbi:MAG TPA: lysylphosphatidylglycerol synthase transmembrane domain-containing protein [Anaerolineae bacterium]|nr:lysylphosphatidylglycerol synthase transmembrane domain-containing protein [Anaerolineae bacterium]
MSTASPPERTWRSPRSIVWLALGFILSAIIIGLIARAIDPDRLALALRSTDWAWIGVALALTLVTYLVRAQRWIILLRPLSCRFISVLRALLTGQLLNHLLPIRVGDVVRSIVLGREPGGSFARMFGSVLLEKAWDWLALCVLVLIVTWAAPLPDWFLTPARSIGLVAALVLLGLVAIAVVPERWIPLGMTKLDRALAGLPAPWRSFILRNIERLLDSLTVLRRRDTIIGAAIWTVVTWGLSIIINYAVQRAFSIESWIAAATLLVVLILGVALPPSIAALGIFEGLSMLTLSIYHVPLETALAIGLTLHLVVIVPLVICTAISWLVRTH